MNHLSREEILRYSRHLMIPGVGLEGQSRLKAASVLLVGTGGLGSPIALYLAAAGVGHIVVVDYDVVDESNLQRQIAHSTAGVGTSKAESARARMLEINPFIQVDAINEPFTRSNARQIAEGCDVLVDGTDNFPTRYLLNDLAALTGRPYVHGSIYRFEGQVSVFDARKGPCYRCLFPEPAPPDLVPTCAEGGVFGVLPGTIGTIQATETIKIILGIGQPLVGRLLLYDALEMGFTTVQLQKNPQCMLCGEKPRITDLIDYTAFCGGSYRRTEPAPDPAVQMEPKELAVRLKEKRPPRLVDVREPVEQQVSHLPGAENIPVEALLLRLQNADRNEEIVLFCRTETRSRRGRRLLQAAGFTNVRVLRGGINAWVSEIDPEMNSY